MAEQQGVSFIPKQPNQPGVRHRQVRKVYVLAYISFVLFIGTLLAAAGTFVYKLGVERDLAAQQQRLIEERDRFSQADISRLQELDVRLSEAVNLLDNHIDTNRLFEELANVVVEDVTFNSFELTRTDGTNVEVTIEGVTTNGFDTVLFQRSVLAASPMLSAVSIEEVSGQSASESSEGLVNNNPEEDTLEIGFSLVAILSPEMIGYVPPVSEGESEEVFEEEVLSEETEADDFGGEVEDPNPEPEVSNGEEI